MIKQLKLTNDTSSTTENAAGEVSEIFSELAELVPKVKDIATSAKRSGSAAAVADCSSNEVMCNAVLCTSRF